MIGQIPADYIRRSKWMSLPSGEVMAMAQFQQSLSFGMLISLSKGFYKYKCRACENTFSDAGAARGHQCQYEVEFRMVTHRCEEEFRSRQAGGEKAYIERPNPVMSEEDKVTFVKTLCIRNETMQIKLDGINELVEELQETIRITSLDLTRERETIRGLRADLTATTSANIQRNNQEPYRKG